MESYIIIVKRGNIFQTVKCFRGKVDNILREMYYLLQWCNSIRVESYWVRDTGIFAILLFPKLIRREFSELLCKLIELTLDSECMFKIYRIAAKLEENKIEFWIATGKYMVKIEVSKNNEEKFEEYKINGLNLYELRPGCLGLAKIPEPELLVEIRDSVKNLDRVRDLSNFKTLKELFEHLESKIEV